MVKFTVVSWGSEISVIRHAAKRIGFEVSDWNVYDLKENSELVSECISSFMDSDFVLIHPSHDSYWDDIIEGFPEELPVVSYGFSDMFWSASTVPLEIVSAVSAYFLYGGLENIYNMLAFCASKILNLNYHYAEPLPTRWEGIYHPDIPFVLDSAGQYFDYRGVISEYNVGILFPRIQWICGDLRAIDSFIRRIEQFANAICVFCFSNGDDELGTLSSEECIRKYMPEKLDALVDLRSFVQSRDRESYIGHLKEMGIPVFHPLTMYHDSVGEWSRSEFGMTGSETGWTVALPEFQGLTEMIPFSFAEKESVSGVETSLHVPNEERIDKIAKRIERWIRLSKKKNSEKKTVFILHNKPCASVEGTVGSGANLDTLESLSGILKEMKNAGYYVEPPESGEALINEIMSRKAISEFRWTSVEEIVEKGGALHIVKAVDYRKWFSTLPQKVQKEVSGCWGNPPGEEIDGVPPAMLYKGDIVVTGVSFGNVIVCVQPKRGCSGPRCDGKACKILHDSNTPPTHQYLATYHYLDETFGADAIVHIGTHGNLEFLPGKGVGLSDSCYPDIAIGDMPHLYIYNSDNPPEGTTAKRRSYATIIDHMQTVMTTSELYGNLKELEEQIAEYKQAVVSDKARAHALTHTIEDLLEETGISYSINLKGLKYIEAGFDEILEAAHKVVTETYETKIPKGMHIFGKKPDGEDRVEMIYSILSYDGMLNELVSELSESGSADQEIEKLRKEEIFSKEIISTVISGGNPWDTIKSRVKKDLPKEQAENADVIFSQIMEINRRIEDSDETGALLHGLDGRYIEPGPSGLITRGNPEIMPTGRNFYSLDPNKVPTKAAWRIGNRLADEVLAKYLRENDKYPENIAFYWVSTDIMWGDGEVFSQMLKLVGAEPVWKAGKVKSFRIIPLEELQRPRIDITVKIGGIMRDNFFNCIEFLDEVIKAVAELDEPPEANYLRKHSLENNSSDRIFGNRPGTYGNGVNLAIYASAWKDEADIADVFLEWNSYAYGKENFGTPAKENMTAQLKSVNLTFNVAMTDEYDLLGCCCYFGAHGGLTIAARTVSQNNIPVYYGDTRSRDTVEIRTIADEIRRVVRTKLLNPKWIDGMKKHGYKGAEDISKRITHVYGWEATTGEVDDSIFDSIAETFVLNEENRKFFSEKNPWALEEIGRRLLEANARDLWDADPDLIDRLKEAYLDIEGDMEDRRGEARGDIQGGSIDVFTLKEISGSRHKSI
jgi:cobaltochelatase CobN